MTQEQASGQQIPAAGSASAAAAGNAVTVHVAEYQALRQEAKAEI